ncbi:M50 family metallopeptidase [Papillibacter cinnamivorans]|uniref:Regulator of sigma E protease n=1 Tax=Papillibacter cinnamivorans DSM 12816 TaxID=1122930 RepID=A0A1W1YMQ7_9FIRM|nr:M50 family metallopeptidase [Papillibacter cinnamivorans]SMC37081.1 regulator of sigma E protease [Papillibacter cinnamivorans DSM 12816]
MSAFYIIIAILIFSILIAVHEWGHFISAKLLGVQVNEFSIGMGPALFKRQRGETLYSLRALPIGGYCAMEGEAEESDNPRSLTEQPFWKKFIIFVAGSFMNFFLGFLIVLLLFTQAQAYNVPVIDSLMTGFPQELQGENGLMPGDRLVKINGENIYIYSDVALLLSRGEGKNYDLVIDRGGKTVVLNDFPLARREYVVDGETAMKFGLVFGYEEATPLGRLKQAWFNSVDFVRMVRMGLTDVITGAASVNSLSGPVGIVTAISDVGEQSASALDAFYSIAYLMSLIAVNLAVVNMLPFPALDGGRILYAAVASVITVFTRRKPNPKIEAYVNMAGFALLILLIVFVTYSDITKLAS